MLRLHRPGYYTLDELNSERVWTRALAAAGIAVPIPLVMRDGGDYVPVPVRALGQVRQAGMAQWTEGELLVDVLERSDDAAAAERAFEQLGAIEAAMHNQSSAWRPPPGFVRHTVDRDGLMGDAPFWGPFWDHPVFTQAERALVIATRDRIRGAMDRYGRDPATYGMIHADLHPGNLLVGASGLTVIDFDDAAFGWHLYDIAVALVHQRCRRRLPGAARRLRARLSHLPARSATMRWRCWPMFLLVRGLAPGWLGGPAPGDRRLPHHPHQRRPVAGAVRGVRGAVLGAPSHGKPRKTRKTLQFSVSSRRAAQRTHPGSYFQRWRHKQILIGALRGLSGMTSEGGTTRGNEGLAAHRGKGRWNQVGAIPEIQL